MSKTVERAADWVYRGVWGVLTSWFNVPQDPPTLPATGGEAVRAFKPSPKFVAYRKFYFWLLLSLTDVVFTAGWVAVLVVNWVVGLVLLPVYVAVAFVPDILAFIAIHLEYDTTWYVLSGRSMRIRRGIWVIRETTITYENIQNINVRQGPVERWFGIATLTVHTAGGGGGGGASKGKHGTGTESHVGMIQGITDAAALRDEIAAHVERSRAAGLGDEHRHTEMPMARGGIVLGPEHIRVLAEIRELVRARAG